MRRESGPRARYEEIAHDLAKRIAQGKLAEGERILGRSSLAGMYKVSPETIRRAVAILYERGIVQPVAGSGIRVLSCAAAMEYLEALDTQNALEEETRELRRLLNQRRKLDDRIGVMLERVISELSGALVRRHVEEIRIDPAAWVVGRSLGDIRLRSQTGATAVAITRNQVDYFSPPADMLLAPGDIVTLIGPEAARARAREVLNAQTTPIGQA